MNSHIAFDILESSPDGIALFDSQCIVMYANVEFCKLWNLDHASILGMSQEALHVHKLDMLHDPQSDSALLSSASGQAIGTDTHYIRLKNGRWYERLTYNFVSQGRCQGFVVQWRDVTRRQNASVLLQTERDLLHSMMDSVPHQIYFKDTESRFTRVNKALAARYGLTNTEDVIGKSDADFYSPAHAEQTRLEELEIMASLTPQLNQLHHEKWDDGSDAWNVSTKFPLLDAKGKVIGVYGIAHDITEQKRAEAFYWKQANFDALTGLPNRRLMQDRWEQAVELHRRRDMTLALVIIDLDHFKDVNDTLGHAFGDELLVLAAKRMGDCVRASDTLARLGGDEFVLILSEVSSASTVEVTTNKILACLSTPFPLAGQDVRISGSLGVSICRPGDKELGAFMRAADKAMYQVKSSGGNGCVFAPE